MPYQQYALDNIHNGINITIDFVIPKSKHLIVGHCQRRITRKIALSIFALVVLPAISFNDKHRLPTFEVNDMSKDRRLTAKMKSQFAQLPQPNP